MAESNELAKLEEALILIRNTCKANELCSDCPLSDHYNECAFMTQTRPDKWVLKCDNVYAGKVFY